MSHVIHVKSKYQSFKKIRGSSRVVVPISRLWVLISRRHYTLRRNGVVHRLWLVTRARPLLVVALAAVRVFSLVSLRLNGFVMRRVTWQ